MKFVLFHGAFGSPGSNWLPELKEDLESLNQVVVAPAFPVDTWDHVTQLGKNAPSLKQNLKNWMAEFDKVYKTFRKGEPLCFVGHSLGPVFILHIVEKYHIKLDSAIFVCPFLERLGKSWQIDNVNESFYKTDFDFKELRKFIPVSYVVYSSNDPYVEQRFSKKFGEALDSSMILLKRGGHLNDEVHLSEFPLVRDLCYSRLDLSLYQKFLDHYKKQSAQWYITQKKDSGILKIKPEEVIDEGIFHFRHLTKGGFSTLYTGIQKFWDPESTYMQYGREAAKRTKAFTRVIVIADPSDVHSPVLKKQVSLDLEAGIHIYSVMWNDIKDVVKEPDFGMWDKSYVCVVRIDQKTNNVIEAELNSRTEDMKQYEEWQKYIMQRSKVIHSVQDLYAKDPR